jgi:hypothetical protein
LRNHGIVLRYLADTKDAVWFPAWKIEYHPNTEAEADYGTAERDCDGAGSCRGCNRV